MDLPTEALSTGTLTSPLRLSAFLEATTASLAVDETLSIGELRDLAVSLRDVRRDDLTFLTAPVAGLGRSADGQSIVELDDARCASLWEAMRADRMADRVASNDVDTLGEKGP